MPKLTGADAEGGAAAFEVQYFDHKAYLATSPQLYKQIMVGVLERVFTTTSIYRAEKHSTTRHLNEYTSMDLEYGFIKDHTDIMDIEERMLRFMMDDLRAHSSREFEMFSSEIPVIPEKIPRLKLREAQEILGAEYGQSAPASRTWSLSTNGCFANTRKRNMIPILFL